MRQGLSQSVPTRIVANRTMERQLLFDISHPDAFANSGKFHTALLDEQDFALNRAAFAENGYSKGMFYNTYCNARVTLSDGRVYVFGGHDMQSNNGIYKVNIFDPETEKWVPRRSRARGRTGPAIRSAGAVRRPIRRAVLSTSCDPRDQQSTQPSDPSDQKYCALVSVGDPAAERLGAGGRRVRPGQHRSAGSGSCRERTTESDQNDAAFTATRVNIVVPEVYDPETDRNIALENARMAFPLYPQLEVVQTGPGEDDWRSARSTVRSTTAPS